MTLNITSLVDTAAADSLEVHNKRIISKYDINVRFGNISAAPLLAICYPVAYNTSTAKYSPWMAPDPSKIVVTLTAAESGTWTLTVNGVATGNIAYNAAAADVVAALRAIGYRATVVKALAVYTITFDDEKEVNAVPATLIGTVTSIVGGSPTAEADTGTSTNGTHKIVGFVNPNDIQTHATEDVLGIISVEGEVTYAEIAALVASGDVTALQAALKDGLVEKGIYIQGLPGIH
jgi:hypothetical protein